MPGGRNKIELDLVEVEQLSAQGLNEQQVADALGIHQATLARRKKASASFADALKKGKARGVKEVTNFLFEQAEGGNTSAAIFFLKNRAGWTDKTEQTHGVTDGVAELIKSLPSTLGPPSER